MGKFVPVQAEQGADNTIMFTRFLPNVTEAGAHITFSVQHFLESSEFKFAKPVEVGSGKIEPTEFDYRIPLLSLPNRFDIKSQVIGMSEEYIAFLKSLKTQNRLFRELGLFGREIPTITMTSTDHSRSRNTSGYWV